MLARIGTTRSGRLICMYWFAAAYLKKYPLKFAARRTLNSCSKTTAFLTVTPRTYCVNWASRSRRLVRPACEALTAWRRVELIAMGSARAHRTHGSGSSCCWQLRRCAVRAVPHLLVQRLCNWRRLKRPNIRPPGELWNWVCANATAGHRCYIHCSPVSQCCFRHSPVYS